jgi:hypothetical protein
MRRPPRTSITLAAAIAAAVVAAIVSVALYRASTPDRPDRGEVISALKRDPRTSDVPDSVAGCVADWYLDHATTEQLRALLDGDQTTDPDTTDATVTPEAKEAILDCLKDAT